MKIYPKSRIILLKGLFSVVKRGTELFLSRKGQISLFIIAGVIILIGFGLFFYVRSQSVKSTLPPVPVLEEIPLQLNPVREYTQSCIESLAKEALVKVGSQGGYIDLERVGIITSAILPTEADGIKFSPEGDLNIPYWWYLKADNDCAKNCIFSSQQPDLQRASGGASDKSIESQVDIYIEENLEACLQNYQPLEDQGFVITEQGNAIVVTLIGEEEIIIFVEYPIEASLGDTTAELKQYFSVIPLDLKKIYALANEIKLAEINYNFLERHTLNLITSFASLNPDGLPPKSESTFEFGTGKTWNTFDVQKKIEQMLMTYIPALQVPFTRDYQKRIFPGDKIKTNVYANEIPANFDNIYPDLGVRFDYLGWWPIYFNAGQGGLIRSESITAPGLPIGYQRYATTYDISFPTLITITDPDAFGGEGYTFMFALEGNLRNKKPLDESFDGGEGIHFFQPSLACNPNQRNSGNVTILTRDHNNNPVDVNIAYTCGTETCSIGETENGELTAKFPVCTNGIVSYLAQDYFASVDILSNRQLNYRKAFDNYAL